MIVNVDQSQHAPCTTNGTGNGAEKVRSPPQVTIKTTQQTQVLPPAAGPPATSASSLMLNVDLLDSRKKNLKAGKNEQHVLSVSMTNVNVNVPDGGYGWVVVLASFMCNLTVDGICYTFGIFLPHLVDHFDSNEAVTALTGSLLSGCYMTVGVFVSCLVNRYGCRPVTMIGGVLASIGFVLSTRAPNVYLLMLTYGVMTGSSFGLIYLPSIVSVGHYFTNKRAFATAIAVCGSGFGAFLFSPICQWLLSKYHWQESLLILSGCIALCVLYGLLMKPLAAPNNSIVARRKLNASITTVDRAGVRTAPKFDESWRSRSTLSVNSVRSGHSSIRRRPRTWTVTSQLTQVEAFENGFDLKDILDISVLKMPAMFLLALSNVFGMIGYYIPYVYLVRYAQHNNIEGSSAAWLLSAVGISNVVGRLVFGLVSDRFSGTQLFSMKCLTITALLINNVCLMLAGLTVIGVAFCTTYASLMTASILFGFTISSYMSLTSIILVDLLSIELLTTTFGLLSCVRGLSSIIGPPLAGLLYDWTYSYTSVFISSGALLCLSSLVSMIVHRYEHCE